MQSFACQVMGAPEKNLRALRLPGSGPSEFNGFSLKGSQTAGIGYASKLWGLTLSICFSVPNIDPTVKNLQLSQEGNAWSWTGNVWRQSFDIQLLQRGIDGKTALEVVKAHNSMPCTSSKAPKQKL